MAAGPVVDELARDLASRPVLMVGYELNRLWVATSPRYSRFWSGCGCASAYLPLTMVSSGHAWADGTSNIYNRYKAMIDAELARPAGAELQAWARTEAGAVDAWVRVVNRSPLTLSATNAATVCVLVWEDTTAGVVGRPVRGATCTPITGEVAPGGEWTGAVHVVPEAVTSWAALRSVALVDAKDPLRPSAFDMLQAAPAQAAQLGVAPAELALTAAAPTATVHLDGPEVLAWTTSAPDWLSVTPAGAALPADVTVTLRPDRMPADSAQATITISASGAGMAFQRAVTVSASRPIRSIRRRLPRVD